MNPFLRIVEYVRHQQISHQEAAASLAEQRQSIEKQRAALAERSAQIAQAEAALRLVQAEGSGE